METVYLLPDREIRDLVHELKEAVKELREKKESVKDFVGNEEFIKLLGVSKRTAQTWRDDGVIAFSQIGGKIYYLSSDIEGLLKKNRRDLIVNNSKRNRF
jgi:hypothetical protein